MDVVEYSVVFDMFTFYVIALIATLCAPIIYFQTSKICQIHCP